MSFLDRIAECSVFDPARYREFRLDGREIGLVANDFAEELRLFEDVFVVADESVTLAPRLADFKSRTAAVDCCLRELKARGRIKGWRDEHYPVAPSYSAPALFTMERAAVPLFGVRGYGVHMNGIVADGGRVKMWIGKRSLTKPTGPGKLDQLVAGGQPAGMSLKANLIKECEEEAAIPLAIAARAVPIGGISYLTERAEGLRRDVLFNYDLELPPDFQPRNTDGEIDAFYLWPIEQVIEVVRDSDRFKFNCALVVIDFLIRRGFIEPDHPEYVDLLKGLHG
jgi:hypothetical protein